jgi:NAD(P) transhydrogenase subunit alpha
MLVGVPTETAPGERRVALVPDVASRLVGAGFTVAVERGAVTA